MEMKTQRAKKAITYRGYLEVRAADGTTEFAATNMILRSPALQEQCIEKRVLRAIMTKLRKHGMLNDTIVSPGSGRLQ
jgi:hypothetical protein